MAATSGGGAKIAADTRTTGVFHAHVHDCPPGRDRPLPDGRYRYRPVRHHLGIQGFGVTAWVGAAAGDPIINKYDEDSEAAEELFIVLSGRAIFELEGEKVDATRGTLVFTAQGTRRTAVAAEQATTILVVDGTPGKAYDASGWELWAPLRPLYDKGEHAELRARLEDVIAANPSIRCSSTTWPAARA